MYTRGEASPAEAAGARPLLERAVNSLIYLGLAAFLCWRTTHINESCIELAALPAFLCVTTALVLVVMAVTALLRTSVREEGPS